MTKDLVSIVIPVYNVEHFLQDCFDSIEHQTYKNIEVIFVNDGSTDGSKQLLEQFCSSHTYAKLINQENKGLAATRAVGIAQATGEFLYNMDPDDMIHPQIIEIFVRQIKNANADFVCGYNKKCKENVSYNSVNWKLFSEDNARIIDKENLVRFISGEALGSNCSIQVKLYRMSTLQKVPGFPQITPINFSLGEDYIFNASVIPYCERAVIVKHCLHLWRQRHTSLTHTKKFNTRDINVLDAHKPFLNSGQHSQDVVKAILGKRAFHAIMLLYTMKKSKYYVLEDVEHAYNVFKKSKKYMYSRKYHPFYFIFLPASILYFRPFVWKVRRLNKKNKV